MQDFLELREFFTNTEQTAYNAFRIELTEQIQVNLMAVQNHQAFMLQLLQQQAPDTQQKIITEHTTSEQAIEFSRKIFDEILALYPERGDFISNLDAMYAQPQRFGKDLHKAVSFLAGFLENDLGREHDLLKLGCLTLSKILGQECRKAYSNLKEGYQDLGLVLYHAIAIIYAKKIADNHTFSEDEAGALANFTALSPDTFPTFVAINKGSSTSEMPHSRDYGEEWQKLPALIASYANESGRI